MPEPIENSDESGVGYECRHCWRPRKQTRRGLAGQGHVWSSASGQPYPLGVSWHPEEQSYNFALYSKHAERVELLFFHAEQLHEPISVFRFEPLRNKSGRVWHCRLPVGFAKAASYYAFRIDGPATGVGFDQHAFDPDKLLLDPYARSVYFPPGFDRAAARGQGSNVGRAPLALLDECQCSFEWQQDDGRVRHEADLIIYEMHVRGFTRHHSSGVPAGLGGTFQGVIEKIPYLVELGVTAVELMPVFQFDPQEGSYWGYMPLSFFAPHHGYSSTPDSCSQRIEFLRMVQALHRAGLEVILDVVFNHSCEGDERGPCYGLKGIDNSTYYVGTEDAQARYANFSGCGNTLHTANVAVRQLVIDSLRYWAGEMHVDGFRFDLASVFTRSSDGSINVDDPPIFAEIASDPLLAGVRMIAEPWDAAGNLLLGSRFPGTLWSQWNAKFRDTLQRFVRGDAGLVGDLMTRLYGSSDLFPDEPSLALRPFQSVNFVASHDGKTLYDLVAYARRHNEANGHGNTDGPVEYAANCGQEGELQVTSEVMALRKQQVRNFFCLLMLSNGTPMFRMGDEFLHTQRGNSNPYNQDNETSWLDWSRQQEHRDVFLFFRDMIAFRKAHPSLSRFSFWREDVCWFGRDSAVDLSFESHSLAFFLSGTGASEDALYVMINGSDTAAQFVVQRPARAGWRTVIDTSQAAAFACDSRDLRPPERPHKLLGPRSVVVLAATPPRPASSSSAHR